MARFCAVDLELELRSLPCYQLATHGLLGKEEGSKVQKGVWEQVSEEEVCHVAGDLVNEKKQECYLGKYSCRSNFGTRSNEKGKHRYICIYPWDTAHRIVYSPLI